MAERVQISHYYTTGTRTPNVSNLTYGELALSISGGSESIFLKNNKDVITIFSSDNKFLKQSNIFRGINKFLNTTSFSADINVTGNTTIDGTCTTTGGFFDTSDEQLKIFENDINVNLDDIKTIKKSYFHYKHDDKNRKHIGVSAQDIEKIYPEITNINNEGYLTVDYSKLSVIALKAIDVLSEENKNLKSKLSDLEKRLELLENK